ncbi:MAG: hypothetical protein K2M10_10485 [Muribaculaceae bacterium]|nr:hypothetical protein [Muribaculaceae bacterium]
MKKFKLYSLAAIALVSFAACDGYEEPNPQPQTNPQETVLTMQDISEAPAVSSEVYNLEALNEANQNLVISTITAPVPEGYALNAVATVSNNDFAREIAIPTSVVDNEDGTYSVVVAPAALNTVYTSNFSMNPADATLKLRYILQVSKDKEVATVGGPANFYGPYTINFKPVDSGLILEDSYYLIGTMCDWSVENAIAFTATGTDPWENPVFYVTVDITEAMVANGCYWKVLPGSVQATGNWGSGICSQWGVAVDGDTAMEGALLPTNAAGEEPNAGKLEVAGRYKWTINVLEGTYKIEEIAPLMTLWTPGESNGWNQEASQLIFGTDGSNYAGYAHLSGGFKFTSEPNWNGVNYGNAGEEGKLTTDGAAGNLTAPEDGLYYCTVDVPGLTYTITKINQIGIIGGFNSWGGDELLSPSADFLTWTGEITLDGGEFKFRMNGNWDINLGGAISDLTQGGDNLSGYNGTYDVTLNFSSIPYTCTLIKK